MLQLGIGPIRSHGASATVYIVSLIIGGATGMAAMVMAIL